MYKAQLGGIDQLVDEGKGEKWKWKVISDKWKLCTYRDQLVGADCSHPYTKSKWKWKVKVKSAVESGNDKALSPYNAHLGGADQLVDAYCSHPHTDEKWKVISESKELLT